MQACCCHMSLDTYIRWVVDLMLHKVSQINSQHISKALKARGSPKLAAPSGRAWHMFSYLVEALQQAHDAALDVLLSQTPTARIAP